MKIEKKNEKNPIWPLKKQNGRLKSAKMGNFAADKTLR